MGQPAYQQARRRTCQYCICGEPCCLQFDMYWVRRPEPTKTGHPQTEWRAQCIPVVPYFGVRYIFKSSVHIPLDTTMPLTSATAASLGCYCHSGFAVFSDNCKNHTSKCPASETRTRELVEMNLSKLLRNLEHTGNTACGADQTTIALKGIRDATFHQS